MAERPVSCAFLDEDSDKLEEHESEEASLCRGLYQSPCFNKAKAEGLCGCCSRRLVMANTRKMKLKLQRQKMKSKLQLQLAAQRARYERKAAAAAKHYDNLIKAALSFSPASRMDVAAGDFNSSLGARDAPQAGTTATVRSSTTLAPLSETTASAAVLQWPEQAILAIRSQFPHGASISQLRATHGFPPDATEVACMELLRAAGLPLL
jgi:hypothetical protein